MYLVPLLIVHRFC